MSATLKRCGSCKSYQPRMYFYKDKSRADGLANSCKSCRKKAHAVYERERYATDPVFRERIRLKHVKRAYGLTPEAYQSLSDEQQGLCAICAAPLHTLRCTHVDHCHKSGRVRGLLCFDCNTGIGKLKDDPTLLLRAVEYLTK